MGSIDLDFLKKLESPYSDFKVFIETGTCHGRTTFALEPYFDEIHTIEIKKEFHETTKSKYSGNKINFILGDSSTVFDKLLPTITKDAIFFLDGHWSAGDTGKGSKDCPLIEELQSINANFKHKAILIIDDRRLFGMGPNVSDEPCNWEDISEGAIINAVKNRISKIYSLPSQMHPNDRFVIHLNKL